MGKYKTGMTVKKMKTKFTQSCGLTLFASFYNHTLIFPCDLGCGLNSPEVGTKSALKYDKEFSASFYAIEQTANLSS